MLIPCYKTKKIQPQTSVYISYIIFCFRTYKSQPYRAMSELYIYRRLRIMPIHMHSQSAFCLPCCLTGLFRDINILIFPQPLFGLYDK